MASLILLGFMMPIHMQKGWEQDRNRVTAIVMLVICGALIASGYGLYYCGDDDWRAWISGIHIAAGCAFPAVLAWHIFTGRRWTIDRFFKPRSLKTILPRKNFIRRLPEEELVGN
jgi:hypothetical protein